MSNITVEDGAEMTVPPDDPHNGSASGPDAPLDFDPYRYGAPEHPVPAEYAPLDFDPYRFGAPEQPVPAQYAPPGYRQPALPREPDLPRTPPPPSYGAAYQPPPYPPKYPMPQGTHRTSSGKAVASMVLGIASILLCWLTFFDVVPVILAVVFGIIALNDIRREAGRPGPRRGGRGMAITGIICAAIGAVLAIVLTTWFVHLANQCGGFNSDSSQLQQCVRDHI